MNVFSEILLLFTFCPIYSHKSMRWVLYVFGVKKKKKRLGEITCLAQVSVSRIS